MQYWLLIGVDIAIFQDDEYLKVVDDAWDEAWDIINSTDGWKEVKKNDLGDVVVTKKNKRGNKIMIVTIFLLTNVHKISFRKEDL